MRHDKHRQGIAREEMLKGLAFAAAALAALLALAIGRAVDAQQLDLRATAPLVGLEKLMDGEAVIFTEAEQALPQCIESEIQQLTLMLVGEGFPPRLCRCREHDVAVMHALVLCSGERDDRNFRIFLQVLAPA